jgi:DNA/RNA-binding domain of Phe-tRNA-synthetase-like protein
MEFIIAPGIIERYTDLRVGILVARDIVNGPASPALQTEKEQAVEALRQRLPIDELGSHPHIIAWRDTYRSFGCNPRDFRPTAEALVRRALRGNPLPTINAAVDSYLLVELEVVLPIGGYDLDTISGDVILRHSPGGEPFLPLGAQEHEATIPGEVVYTDAAGILTRRWNFRDADRTKITLASRNVALFCEAASPTIETSALETALNSLKGRLEHFCGGHAATDILDVHRSSRIALWPRARGIIA